MTDSVSVSLPFGMKTLEARIPAQHFGGVFSLPQSPGSTDLEGAILRAIRCPEGSEPLACLAAHSRRALFLIDDLTRVTPADRILPLLVEELRSGGIAPEDMAVLFALGSHRPLSPTEMARKIGPEMARTILCRNHDYRGQLEFIGETDLGTPIEVNPMLGEYDLIIGIGSIVPHRFCGWSGGGKIVQPGVCGERTITATHLLVTKDPSLCLGSESNLALSEIRRVAELAGLRFIVNTVSNGSGEVTDVVAGAPEAAHRAGIARAREVLGVSMPEADVVVVSSFHEDANLWQAMKALYAAQRVVRKGGRIILVSPLHEGAGEHPEIISLMALGTRRLRQVIEGSGASDMLCAAAAYAEAMVLEHASVDVVSGSAMSGLFEGTPLGHYSSLQAALDRACSELDESGVVTVLREGPISMPFIGE